MALNSRQRLSNGPLLPVPANDRMPLWQEVQQVLDGLPRQEWLPFLAVVEQRARERQDQRMLRAVQQWRQRMLPQPTT